MDPVQCPYLFLPLVEFVTKVTIPVRVGYFQAQVKFSRISAKKLFLTNSMSFCRHSWPHLQTLLFQGGQFWVHLETTKWILWDSNYYTNEYNMTEKEWHWETFAIPWKVCFHWIMEVYQRKSLQRYLSGRNLWSIYFLTIRVHFDNSTTPP